MPYDFDVLLTLRYTSCFAVLALAGCYDSVTVDLPPEQRLIFVESSTYPFDEDVIGMSASRDGLHVAVRRELGNPVERYARMVLLGVSADGTTTYEHAYPDDISIMAPRSDALGRPSIIVGPFFEPIDFGNGPLVPVNIRSKGTYAVVSYDARGALRHAFRVADAGTDFVLVHDFDVADDGTIVVCGYSHVERRQLFVRVFEPDGTTRALRLLGLPPIASTASCAIDAEGSVLVFGSQADIDDPAADIRNPGLMLLDRELEVVMPSTRFSGFDIEIAADPRGFFIVQCQHEDPHMVDTTAYPGLRTGSRASVIAIVSSSGSITHVHEVVAFGNDDEDDFYELGHIGMPNHDAHNSLVRFGYQDHIDDPEGPIDTSTAAASVLMVEFDERGAFDRPFSLPYDRVDFPDYALTVGARLWLVNTSDRQLSIAQYVWHRTLDR